MDSETMRRWYAGEAVEGARFRRGDAVALTVGRCAGQRGAVLVLERLDPPTYLVALSAGDPLMVLESGLDAR